MSETPVIKSIESFIMVDRPETPIEPKARDRTNLEAVGTISGFWVTYKVVDIRVHCNYKSRTSARI